MLMSSTFLLELNQSNIKHKTFCHKLQFPAVSNYTSQHPPVLPRSQSPGFRFFSRLLTVTFLHDLRALACLVYCEVLFCSNSCQAFVHVLDILV